MKKKTDITKKKNIPSPKASTNISTTIGSNKKTSAALNQFFKIAMNKKNKKTRVCVKKGAYFITETWS